MDHVTIAVRCVSVERETAIGEVGGVLKTTYTSQFVCQEPTVRIAIYHSLRIESDTELFQPGRRYLLQIVEDPQRVTGVAADQSTQ